MSNKELYIKTQKEIRDLLSSLTKRISSRRREELERDLFKKVIIKLKNIDNILEEYNNLHYLEARVLIDRMNYPEVSNLLNKVVSDFKKIMTSTDIIFIDMEMDRKTNSTECLEGVKLLEIAYYSDTITSLRYVKTNKITDRTSELLNLDTDFYKDKGDTVDEVLQDLKIKSIESTLVSYGSWDKKVVDYLSNDSINIINISRFLTLMTQMHVSSYLGPCPLRLYLQGKGDISLYSIACIIGIPTGTQHHSLEDAKVLYNVTKSLVTGNANIMTSQYINSRLSKEGYELSYRKLFNKHIKEVESRY